MAWCGSLLKQNTSTVFRKISFCSDNNDTDFIVNFEQRIEIFNKTSEAVAASYIATFGKLFLLRPRILLVRLATAELTHH